MCIFFLALLIMLIMIYCNYVRSLWCFSFLSASAKEFLPFSAMHLLDCPSSLKYKKQTKSMYLIPCTGIHLKISSNT